MADVGTVKRPFPTAAFRVSYQTEKKFIRLWEGRSLYIPVARLKGSGLWTGSEAQTMDGKLSLRGLK